MVECPGPEISSPEFPLITRGLKRKGNIYNIRLDLRWSLIFCQNESLNFSIIISESFDKTYEETPSAEDVQSVTNSTQILELRLVE